MNSGGYQIFSIALPVLLLISAGTGGVNSLFTLPLRQRVGRSIYYGLLALVAIFGTVGFRCAWASKWFFVKQDRHGEEAISPSEAGAKGKRSTDSHEKAQETQKQQITEIARFTRWVPFCADLSATEDPFFVPFVLLCGDFHRCILG